MNSHATKKDIEEARNIMAEYKLLGNDATENHRNILLTALLIKMERLVQALFNLESK